jgi:hypothetical protein
MDVRKNKMKIIAIFATGISLSYITGFGIEIFSGGASGGNPERLSRIVFTNH